MKKLILKTSVFASLLLFGFILLFLLPPAPRVSKSLLFAAVKKDSLLANTPSPRIIFVGGSNLSFGLNSKKIKNLLHVNPINTAIHAGIGIKYMLENVMLYAKKGDIIVFVPEYEHFYYDWNRGSEELLRTVFDVNRKGFNLLNNNQIYNCFKYSGRYVLSKIDIFQYFRIKESGVYSVDAFNEYGDVDVHWNLENRYDEIKPEKTLNIIAYNPQIMSEIKLIADKLQKRGCIFLISYPCYQETSFNNSKEFIKKIEQEYGKHGFTVLGAPERYMAADSLMFNTKYHLNKQGLESRTDSLIEDLKTVRIDSLGLLK